MKYLPISSAVVGMCLVLAGDFAPQEISRVATVDGLHLSHEGHALMAEVLAKLFVTTAH